MIVRDADAPGGEKTKLLDFGIAKLAEGARGSQPKTQSQMVMGTPQYMSPEQCKGASHVDEKTDVYALGTLLFELLAGRTPFLAESGGEYIGMHLFKPAPRLAELAPSIPADLAAYVDSLLVKDPAGRPSMAAVGDKLGQFVRRYGSPSFASEQHYAQPGRGGSPTVRLGAISTLGQSIGQLGRGALATRSRIAGAVGLLVLAGAGVVRLRTLAPARAPAPTAGQLAQPTPPSAPVKRVHWTISSTPPGAAIVDSNGQVLGRTPWQETAVATTGTRTLTLQQAGYAAVKVSLDCSADANRQERLQPLAVETAPADPKPKRPPGKIIPDKIEYIE